jgi:predicted  nucleic acid-binding Zn-ribbon protein
MKSLQDLKDEIARERKYSESEKEINEIGEERKRLSKELSELKNKRKYGKFKPTISSAGESIKKVYGEFSKVQRNVLEDDRRKKAIRKRGYNTLTERRGLGLF